MNICDFKSGDLVSVGLNSRNMFSFGNLNELNKKISGAVFINLNTDPKSFIAFKEVPEGLNPVHYYAITETIQKRYGIPPEFKYGSTLANTVQAEIVIKRIIGDFANGEEIELALNKNKCPVWDRDAEEIVSYVRAKVYRLPEESFSILAYDSNIRNYLHSAWSDFIPKKIIDIYKIDPRYTYYTTIAHGLLAKSYTPSKKTKEKSSIPLLFLLGSAAAISISMNKKDMTNEEQRNY